MKKCPKCGKTKKIETSFGWRAMNGKKYAKAYCKDCTSGKSKPVGPVKKVVNKVQKLLSPTKDFGRPPRDTPTYRPIKNFDPNNAPSDFIIVKFNHELLDDALQSMTKKKAQEVGIPCKRV